MLSGGHGIVEIGDVRDESTWLDDGRGIRPDNVAVDGVGRRGHAMDVDGAERTDDGYAGTYPLGSSA